ncbi:hypothetical protein ACFXHA_44065 [Nocardia sp. NPDC059240]|uniref:hypothetical protein n=1 Tax=Nocardia sp. NPDC059240 TaxID=3346786 RepID=UPI0036AE6DA8
MVERELTVDEWGALDAMLAGSFPGATELRAQALTAKVVGECRCGCPTIDLAVDPNTPTAPDVPNPAREAETEGGGMILFVRNGRLIGLEYYSLTDGTLTQFPTPDRIHPTP